MRALTTRGSGTRFTRLVPGSPDVVGTATHFLSHVEGELVLTRIVVVPIAKALPHVCEAKVAGQSRPTRLSCSRDLVQRWATGHRDPPGDPGWVT